MPLTRRAIPYTAQGFKRFAVVWALGCLCATPAFATTSTVPAASTQPPVAENQAVVDLKQSQPTHPERLLLLYYKLGVRMPPFADWATKSPFLADALPQDKPSILAREQQRMVESYQTLDVTQPVVIQTQVQFDSYSTLQETMFLKEFNDKTFFTFGMYGSHVAIVPESMQTFGALAIPKARMEEILSKTQSTAVTAELFLLPIQADVSAPFMYKDIPHGLILARVAELRFWSRGETPVLLWRYRADWYKPVENQSLIDLKKGQ